MKGCGWAGWGETHDSSIRLSSSNPTSATVAKTLIWETAEIGVAFGGTDGEPCARQPAGDQWT